MTVTVTGTVIRSDSGAVIAGASVRPQVRRRGTSTWTTVATVISSATGRLSYTHKPSWSPDYRWRYSGTTVHVGVDSAVRAVTRT